MWIILGQEELLNLDHCSSIKKGEGPVIELIFPDNTQNRIIQFEEKIQRDLAFEKIIKNFVRLEKALE